MSKQYFFLIFFLIPIWVYSSSYDVAGGNNDFSTIQSAINYASNEDTINVYSGNFGPLSIGNKGLLIQSADENCEVVITDGDQSVTSCITFTADCSALTILKGLRITDGGPVSQGGGIKCFFNRDITIDGCVIIDNESYDVGGGIHCGNYGHLTILNSRVDNNTSLQGGGIWKSNGDLTVEDTVVRGNTALSGGGIYSQIVSGNGETSLNRVEITGNGSSHQNSSGGGIEFRLGYFNSEFSIENSTIADNYSNTYSAMKLVNGPCYVYVTNSIIWDNPGTSELPAQNGFLILSYCCVDDYTGTGNIDSDPEFLNPSFNDYRIAWGSPCIDTGDPNTDLDPDYSPADIGCYPYERDHFSLDNSARYHWHCFPRLDVADNFNNGESDDYLEPDDAMDNFWSLIPNHIYVYFLGSLATTGTNYNSDLEWDPDNFQLYSYDGFKFGSGSNSQFYIGGYLMDPNYVFDDLNVGMENWLGYFLEESQYVNEAISGSFMSNLLQIKTQRWSMVRATLKDPWQISAGANYIFNYGDLVILVPGKPVTGFHWQQPRDITEPYIRPRAEHFEWEDELDYLPVIATFDPENLPQEIAIYADGVCNGAQVVDDTLCQICAYILDEDPGSNIEFAFYDGTRGIHKQDFSVLDVFSGKPTGNKLTAGFPGSFYKVSFKKEKGIFSSNKYLLHSEPNPFNPVTEICFELEEKANVNLNIYNIKGQLVRSLSNELFRPGSYRILWNGKDDNGNSMSSGIYFYRMICGDDLLTDKMILLK